VQEGGDDATAPKVELLLKNCPFLDSSLFLPLPTQPHHLEI
jgi:hypothetical protein